MTQPKKNITVKVTADSLKDRLRKGLVLSYPELLTTVIIENLARTEVGLEQLFKAFSGIEDKPKFRVGEHMMLTQDAAYTWKYDKTKMEEAGLLFQERIKCQILSIDMYKKAPYEVTYTALNTVGGSEDVKHEVEEKSICREDEWPGDGKQGDDLPF